MSPYERKAQAQPPQSPISLLWLADIEPVLDARDFVQGLLVAGGAAVVYGDSNAGKTFWITDLALHVAAGLDWNGRRVDQGGVIYCALEGGNGFRNRAYAWRQAHVSLDADVPFAAVTTALNLLDADADIARLIAAIKAAQAEMTYPVKLVVVDTLSRAMAGGNENAPDDMGALVSSMDRIRAETGACVLFVHHSGKDAAKGARGHSLLRAAIDTEVEVKADEETGVRTATVVKQRDLAKGGSFAFRLDVVILGQNQHNEDVTTCVVLPEVITLRASSRTTLTETERGWLRDLSDTFGDGEAESRAPIKDMDAVLTLTREQVRSGLRRRGRFSCAPDANLTGADRERMRSMLNKLKDKGKIGLTGELVWLIAPRQVASGSCHV